MTSEFKQDVPRLGKAGTIIHKLSKSSSKKNISSIPKDYGELFHLLMNNVKDYAIFAMNPDGYINSWNKGAEKLFGYKKKEIINKHFSLFFTSHDKAEKKPERELKKAARFGQSRDDKWVLRRNSTPFFSSDVLITIWNKNGSVRAFVKIIKDLTQVKKAEEELKKREERLEIILENIAAGISVQDAKGNLVYINPVAAKLWGYNDSEIMPQQAKFKTFKKHILQRFDIQDEGGNLYSMADLPGARALKGEKKPQAVVQYYDKISQKRRWSQVKARPIFDKSGKVQFAVNIFSDITQQYELEKRKDEFISVASHELKTPLTSLKVYVQVLQKQLENYQNGKSLAYLDRMDKQIDKLNKLIHDLLDISKIQVGKLAFHYETFPIDTLLQEVVESLGSATKKHSIIISRTVDILVAADRDRIGQVLINLISNAIKYSPDSDKIIVAAEKGKSEIIVSVEDFGIGIDKEHQNRIFERFYRGGEQTEKTFPGLGIGLYISFEIIKRHGGILWVESTKGKGTIFRFSLPLQAKDVDNGFPKDGNI